ncbi:hypothetical protein EV652_1282 [Kribbella steppae]|uniref:Uncharacterized protein n=1 Tax=Kribbella steppae TaxID=2512223 RepID=A0A4R2GRV1_9ACTN|nr:hypothetical protein [Kribbella steppae]TCO12831.1 hypothetical protein EV652_1282 [Kribbella steppae]
MTQGDLHALALSSPRGLELELNYHLPPGVSDAGERVAGWFTAAVDSLAGEFILEFPADGLPAAGLRDPAGGPFGPPDSRWCSLFVLAGSAGKRQSKSLRQWTPRNWQQFLGKASDLSIEMSAKFSTLNSFGHSGEPSLTISAHRHRKLKDWVSLSAVYVVGDMRSPALPGDVPALWRDFLYSYVEQWPPAFGYLADDSIAAGATRTPLEARTQTFPTDTLPQTDSFLRGYSWITVTSAQVAERAGGIGALQRTGAFARIAELPTGGLVLQATPLMSEYGGSAVRRVFEALRAVLPDQTPIPDPMIPFFKLIYESPRR